MSRDANRWSAFATPPPELRDQGVVCVGAGWQRGAAESLRDRLLPHHAVVYVARGAGRYAQSAPVARRLDVVGPAVLSVPPGVPHDYGDAGQGWEQYWMLLTGRGVALFERALGASRARPVVTLRAEVEDAPALMTALRRSLGGVATRDHLASSVLAQRMLLALAAEAVAARPSDDGAAARFAELALEAVPMAVRSSALGMTTRELQRRIRAETGQTPADLLIQLRLSHAQALLAETDLTVAAIARQVGYDDAGYFSRLFSRRIGESPSAFRRGQQSG